MSRRVILQDGSEGKNSVANGYQVSMPLPGGHSTLLWRDACRAVVEAEVNVLVRFIVRVI